MSIITKKINRKNFERKSWKATLFWAKGKIPDLNGRKVKAKSSLTIKIKDLRRAAAKTVKSYWKAWKNQKRKRITWKKLSSFEHQFKNRACWRTNIEWIFYTNWNQLWEERLIYAEKPVKILHLQKIRNGISWKVKITPKISINDSQKKTGINKSKFWRN